jgi:hypothetical protein
MAHSMRRVICLSPQEELKFHDALAWPRRAFMLF